MKKQESRIIYSPSDLVRFMESPFASWMARAALEDPKIAEFRDEPDPLLEALAKKGFAHESAFSAQLKEQGHDVLEVKRGTPEIEAQETLKAMEGSKEIIVQGCLSSDNFAGYADYLHKVEGESKLGNYHYEVWDTKLAKKLKPYFVIQLCCYAEMLEAIQGLLPKYITVVLGNKQQEHFLVRDYFAYYQTLKATFLEQQKNFDAERVPDPAGSLSFGDWSSYAEKLLKEKDHLSQIYNIRHATIKNLNRAEITTMQDLASNKETEIRKVSQPAFERLKAQAQLQKKAKENQPPPFELLPHSAEDPKGLHLLPPSSPSDVFFDLEGDPLTENGLEYLWGIAHNQGDFKHFWAHNQAEEKQALTDFIGWVYPRWQADASMHIYHYGAYEITALQQLMGCYGVCENEIDNLLRNEVFVDLYTVIRNGVLIGEPSYSLKNIEKLYCTQRETEIIGGGDSIIAYEQWIENNDPAILKNILAYNRDDCFSTQELAEWLRQQQKENSISYINRKEEKEKKEEENEIIQFRGELLEKAQHTEDEAKAKMIEVFAWSLEFHHRESNPVWWRFFDRRNMSVLDLEDDMDCLIGLQRTATPPFKFSERARTLVYEYRFNPNQPYRDKAETFCILGGSELRITKYDYKPSEGLITFKHKNELPDTMSIIPYESVNTKLISVAIESVIRNCLDNNFAPSVITDFLTRKPPRIKKHRGGAIIKNQDNLLKEVIEMSTNLDNSYLCIQGPPGAGKTYTAIRIIEALLKQGKRIGITSNSHKAINNLLEGVAQKTNDGVFVKIGGDEDALEKDIEYYKSAGDFSDFCSNLCLGGTAWAFCHEGFTREFDYLFVDEAGQVSLANLIGMSRAANNIILMGDQMQLAQPIQGSHPGESGKSILEYLLQEHATIPPELGVFLPNTYRMHPNVCRFISEMVYEGRLQSTISPERLIETSSSLIDKQAGICFIPVEHEGNTQASDEEVEVIKQLAGELIGCNYIDGTKDKSNRTLDWNDILFVAPYNFQVNQLRQTLGKNARIGSVDLFQGQEAPVVILSMCTSDATESPRGVDFIFSKSRLNVAISRAECLAIIIGNPALATTPANNLKQMSQVNMFSTIIRLS